MSARRTAVGIGLGLGAAAAVARLARRQGDPTDARRPLPGDDLVPDAAVVTDTVTVLAAPAERVWPWLVQLGKGRAGWYLPARLERALVPRPWRGLRALAPEFAGVRPGDRVPDWGPGRPEFEAVTVDAPRALVYLSLRDKDKNWTWPDGDAPGALALSWALVLTELDAGHCRLHVRLRVNRLGRRLPGLTRALAVAFDRLTVELLFAGLAERLTESGEASR